MSDKHATAPSGGEPASGWASALHRAETASHHAGQSAANAVSRFKKMASGVEGAAEGAATSKPAESPATATERAEKTADAWGKEIGRRTVQIGRSLRRMAALAREETEDMIAEAQHLSRK